MIVGWMFELWVDLAARATGFCRERTGMMGQAGVTKAVTFVMELVTWTLQLGRTDGRAEKDQQRDSRAVARLQTDW